jgi:hypothetical protein
MCPGIVRDSQMYRAAGSPFSLAASFQHSCWSGKITKTLGIPAFS